MWKLFLVLLMLGCAGPRPAQKAPISSGDIVYDYLVAQMEARAARPDRAIALLSRVLEKEPGHAELWLRRAELRASQGDLSGAEGDTRQAILISPEETEEASTLLGKICQSQGRRGEAALFYQKALKENPENEEVVSLLVEIFIAEKEYRQAIGLLEAWAGRDPEDVRPLLYIATFQHGLLKDPKKAISTYRRVLKIDPFNTKALSSLAGIYLAEDNDREAGRTLQTLRESDPGNVAVQLRIALIYYEAKRYEEAVRVFREILTEHPRADRVVYYLGVVLENVGQEEAALSEFALIEPSSDFFKEARLHMAYLYNRRKRYEEAIELLRRTIELRPGEAQLYEYLAEIYSGRHRFEEAVSILQEGLKKADSKESIHYSLGLVYDRAGLTREGLRAMRAVLKINPNHANAMNYIGYTYADHRMTDKLDEALSLIQRALLLKPDDGFITDSLGWVYFQKGDLDQAYFYIQKAYDLVPGEPTITEHLGDIFWERNDLVKALKYLEESLAILEKKNEDEVPPKDLQRLKEKIERLKGNF